MADLRADLERAAERVEPLAHVAQADAAARVRLSAPGVEAAAVVGDRQRDFARRQLERDGRARRVRMPQDVRQRFLRDTKERRFHGCGQRRRAAVIDLREAELDARFRAELAHELIERGGKAEIVEHRRAQRVRDAAHFAQRIAEPRNAFGQRGLRCVLTRGQVRKALECRFEHQLRRYHHLADPVVQLTRKTRAFLLLRFDHLLREALEFRVRAARFADVQHERAQRDDRGARERDRAQPRHRALDVRRRARVDPRERVIDIVEIDAGADHPAPARQ